MEDKELKKEFELERVILFSDAVFAIIITIMVLELKLPEGLKHMPAEELKKVFKEVIIKGVAYIGSFFLVSSFWIRHLRIFKHLRDYDVPLVVFNLFFLFVISLFPFAISTITSGLSLNSYWTVDIYVGIILTGIFAQTLIIGHIVRHKAKLCFSPDTVEDTLKWKVLKFNYYLFPLSIIGVVLLNVFDVYPTVAVYIIAIYALTLRLLSKMNYPNKKKSAKKHAPVTKAETAES